ncbi:MAG: hypothetical protein R3E01_07475 [Pirellulaceae bacterium]|nr:hypothetical protein [Planctomycetales bacterium]MCA9266669.1 hypothetical protein [Planctomycetales bacterium]
MKVGIDDSDASLRLLVETTPTQSAIASLQIGSLGTATALLETGPASSLTTGGATTFVGQTGEIFVDETGTPEIRGDLLIDGDERSRDRNTIS